jgi:hypothetical protein
VDFVVTDASDSTYGPQTPREDTSNTSSHDGILERRPRWHREYSPYPRTRRRRRSSASERALIRCEALQNVIRPCSCDDFDLSKQPRPICPDRHPVYELITALSDLTLIIRSLSEQLPQGLSRKHATHALVEVLRDLVLSIGNLSEQLAHGLSPESVNHTGNGSSCVGTSGCCCSRMLLWRL